MRFEAAGGLFLFEQGMVGRGARGGKRPFVHLDVGGGWQVHDAARLFARMVVGIGLGADQGRGQHALDELRQPAFLEHPFVGLGPDAEFFDVVEVDRRAASLTGEVFQPGHGLVGGREGQPVARTFRNREQVEAAAVLVGGEKAVEAVLAFAGAEEVVVVHRHVADAGGDQRGHHRGLPDPFGEPGAGRAHAEAALDLVGERGDLRHPVAVRDRRQHGFAVAGAEPLDLAATGHCRQARHVFRKALEQHIQQPAGKMYAEAELRIAFHDAEEHAVAADMGVIDDGGKVADGLVGVNPEQEADGHCLIGMENRWIRSAP